jgi:hypothetical protein
MMRDKVYPADPLLPYDPVLKMSMHHEDYIAYYVWYHMLGLDPSKLQVPKLGITPPHFTVNPQGEDVDLLQDIEGMWRELGFTWYYDYWAGGVLRVDLLPDRNAATTLTINPKYAISLPIEQQGDDWGRPGNVITTVNNVEGRPNHALGRVAPWPDGSDTVQKNLNVASGLPSQHGQALMYAKGVVQRNLQAEWMGAKGLVVDFDAFPYLRPDLVIEFTNPPSYLRGRWRSTSVKTRWNTQELVSTVSLASTEPYLG